jgi:DNA-directed RNA polymerase subunit RPC12/RpoP
MEDRRWLAGGAGEPPANPRVKYAKEYFHSFKEDADLPADFTWDGLDPANCLEFQRDGLHLALPAGHEGKRMGTGLASTFPVQGDFEITLTFDMLREPEPANTGPGSAVYLWVDSNTPPINRAMIMRGVNAVRGKDFSTWIDLKNVPGKPPIQYSNAAPAAARSGRLRLVRTGSMLAQYGAEGSSEEFRFLGNHPLGTDDVRVRIGGFTGGPKAALEARLSDLRIRAGALPEMPGEAEQVAGKGAALVIVLLAFLAMSLTFGVWLAVRSRRTMKTRSTTPATGAQARPETAPAPASVSFRCSGCGRSSKVKAEWAGKKAKCPHCGQVTLVPENSTGIVTPKDADLSS